MFKEFFQNIELINEPFADLKEQSTKLMREYFLKMGKPEKAAFYIPIVIEFAIFLVKKYCYDKTIEYIPTISWMHDYEIYRHTRCIFKCNRYS